MSSEDAHSSDEDFGELRRCGIRCDNCSKSAAEAGMSNLKLCSACSTATYCSVECQRQNWKKHKIDCTRMTSGEFAREAMSELIGNFGDRRRKGTRTMGQVLKDLGAWAREHNGDTLTVVAWQALGLFSDIEARKSKVLLLGLCRTPSTTPRTYYTLKEVCVVPVADLKRIFKKRGPQNPARMLKEEEKVRQADGAIGAVLVMSVEQTEDDSRSVLEAVSQISTMTFQALGVFEEHRISFQRLGQLPEPVWKACFVKGLCGGTFTIPFIPYTGD
ncbi:hypothetical protein DFH09DRAFT_1315829 [Mycena vulgaris]|nr:hypothetical protein DFH09DRAFT_1315829 [Mycena vulgaris]